MAAIPLPAITNTKESTPSWEDLRKAFERIEQRASGAAQIPSVFPIKKTNSTKEDSSKLFNLHKSFVMMMQKSVQDFVRKIVKTVLNISDKPRIQQKSIEEQREARLLEEDYQNAQIEELKNITQLLEKLVKMGGVGGGGQGGGWLDSAVDMALLASTFRRGGRGAAAVSSAGRATGVLAKTKQLGRVAAGGGLGKIAEARNMSAPMKMLAKTSDKVVSVISSAKNKVLDVGTKVVKMGKDVGGRILQKSASLLGLGTKMGAAAAGTGVAAKVATGAVGGAGSAAAQAIPEVAEVAGKTAAASSAAKPIVEAATSTTQTAAQTGASMADDAAAVAKPGFFGKMWGGIKNIGSSALGTVKQLGTGAVELAKAVKNPIAFLKTNKDVILKGIKGSALISALIEPIIGYLNIQDIKENPEYSTQEKKELIGQQVGARVGSGIGSVLGASLGTVGGPLGTILGGVVGSLGGEWVGSQLANLIGAEGIYNMAAGLPGKVGEFFSVEGAKPTSPEQPKPEAQATEQATPEATQTGAPGSPPVTTPTATATTVAEDGTLSQTQVTPTPQAANTAKLEQQFAQPAASAMGAAPIAAPSAQPIVNNYYYNNTAVAPSQPGGSESSAPMGQPSESIMNMMLSADAHGARMGINS